MDTGTLFWQLCTINSGSNGFYSTYQMNVKWGGPPVTPGDAMETNPRHSFWGYEEGSLVYFLHDSEETGCVLSLHSKEVPLLLS